MKKILLLIVTMVLTITLTGCLPVGECDCSEVTFVLEGDNVVNMTTGMTYTDPGYTASTGNISLNDEVTTEGTVDTSTAGTYFIEYTLDYNNEETTLLRAVVVTVTGEVANPDEVLYDGTCENVEIHFIDLDAMGDSTLIDCGDFEVLIDAGLKSAGSNIIIPYLEDYVTDGVIELVIATHPDADHFGGFIGLSGSNGIFEEYTIERILDFGYDKSTTTYSQYEALRDVEGALYCSGDDALNSLNLCQPYFTITEDLILRVIDTGHYDGEDTTNDNENSIVVLLEHGDLSYLFTGDAEFNAELIMSSSLTHVDVYKAGHHGSNTASSTALLNAITPDTVIMSLDFPDDDDGENGYGIPPQEALDRLFGYTDNLYATGVNGTIVIVSNGTTYTVTGSENSVLFKDSTWFSTHRVYPSN